METCYLCKRELRFAPNLGPTGEGRTPMRNLLCLSCGLIQQSPLPGGQAELDRHQAQHVEWRYRQDSPEEILKQSDEKAARQSGRLDPFLTTVLTQRGLNVLDIGCGLGGLLAYVSKAYGAVPYGIEMDPFEADFVRTHRKFQVDEQHIEPWLNANHGRKFSLVILSHVLEHLRDPIQVLKDLGDVLEQDGAILIEVPNALHPLKDPSLYFKPSHLWNFTPRTLSSVIRKSGLKLVGCSGTEGAKLVVLIRKEGAEIQHPRQGSIGALGFRWLFMHAKALVKRVLKKERK